MDKQITQYILRIFSFVWIFIIFLDYWYYHQPSIYLSLKYFQYGKLLFILTVIGVGVYFLLDKLGSKGNSFVLSNGLGVSILFITISSLITVFHIRNIDLPLKLNPFVLVSKVVGVIGFTYLIMCSCYVLGNYIIERLFSIVFTKLENTIVSIAVGIIILSILLFILGVIQLLQAMVIGPLLLMILLIFRRRWLSFLKYTFVQPIHFSGRINWLGFGSFYLLMLFISLIYLQNIRPFPTGFDALAIYMNLPNLIGNTSRLVSGFSPYYWSLFVSLGFILLDNLPLVISLSVSGAILSGFAIYAICRKWINDNYALFSTALFFTLPMVNFQAYSDVKTDLGLLFFMLVVVLVLIKYLEYIYPTTFIKERTVEVKVSRKKVKKKKKKIVKRIIKPEQELEGWLGARLSKDYEYTILLGILSGMVLGIKLTGLILIFSTISGLIFLKTGRIGFLSSVALFLFIILIGKLDVATGLRAYHFGATYFMWTMLVITLLGIGHLWVSKRNMLFEAIKNVLLYAAFVGLIYLPWPIKNFSETGILSISTFSQGRNPGATKNIHQFIQKAKNDR